jgi:glucose-1-phosphate cytidylyltransferase
MKVVLFCGGKGTRLREETAFLPKPMVPIGDLPILWHIMQLYSHYGHNDFIICLGYKGSVIKDWFRNYLWHVSDVQFQLDQPISATFSSPSQIPSWNITLAETGQDNMTGSRLFSVQKYLADEEDFLLTYGDGLGNVDINSSIEYHHTQNKVLTLTGVRPPGRFGEILVDNGRVKTFLEKPQTSSGLVNGGFFVANRRIFDYLHDDPSLVFEREPLTALAADDQLSCFHHSGFWQPMDTYQEFLYLNELWSKNIAPWKCWQ